MSESMTLPRPRKSPEDDPLFSADAASHPGGMVAQRRAEITVAEVEEIYRRSEADRGRTVPDVEIAGAVFKATIQTDSKGAVLVAYTRDAETGRVGRVFVRFDLTGVDYIRRRLNTV